jgi:hypothetical protein
VRVCRGAVDSSGRSSSGGCELQSSRSCVPSDGVISFTPGNRSILGNVFVRNFVVFSMPANSKGDTGTQNVSTQWLDACTRKAILWSELLQAASQPSATILLPLLSEERASIPATEKRRLLQVGTAPPTQNGAESQRSAVRAAPCACPVLHQNAPKAHP